VSHYCQVVVPPGFVDVDGSLLSRGAFHRGVPEDNIHFSYIGRGCCSGIHLWSRVASAP